MKKYPVVILPGWLLGVSRFKPLAHEFEAVGFKTFIVDFPGFEEGIRLKSALNLTDYVKHLQKFLRVNKIEKAIFVSHSFGGRVALKYLSQEPKKAYALILSGTPGFPGITKLRFYIMVALAKIGKIVSFIPPLIFFRGFLSQIFQKVTRAHDYYRSDGNLRETFKNIVREQLVEYMKKLRVPTLLLWGATDRLVSIKIAKKMQKLILKSELTVVPKLGHMFIYREPKVFVRETMKFLTSIEKEE